MEDDESPHLALSKSSLPLDEGAAGATYTVRLGSQPTATVTVTISGHAGTDLGLSGVSASSTLTFTTSSWNTPRTVTVTAADDADAADDRTTLTHTATGGDYGGVVRDLPVTVKDDETASLVLTPTKIEIDEAATGSATYRVRLSSEPTATTTVNITGHTAADLSLDRTSLTFTTSNWNTAQTVTVTASHDDDALDDTVTLTHEATGGDYGDAAPGTVLVTVTDDDEAGLALSKESISPQEGSATGESYTVRLATRPSQTVTVTIGGHSGTDLTLSTTTLTFTGSNWSTPQTVTVTAAEDTDAVDDTETLTHTANGGEYENVTRELAVKVNDTSDMTVSFDSATYSATEGGPNAAVTVQLNAPAPGQLVIPITAEPVGTTETADWQGIPEELTFQTGETDRSFTVVAVDDDIEDDGEMVRIGLGALPADWVEGPHATAEITLMNDDTPAGYVLPGLRGGRLVRRAAACGPHGAGLGLALAPLQRGLRPAVSRQRSLVHVPRRRVHPARRDRVRGHVPRSGQPLGHVVPRRGDAGG